MKLRFWIEIQDDVHLNHQKTFSLVTVCMYMPNIVNSCIILDREKSLELVAIMYLYCLHFNSLSILVTSWFSLLNKRNRPVALFSPSIAWYIFVTIETLLYASNQGKLAKCGNKIKYNFWLVVHGWVACRFVHWTIWGLLVLYWLCGGWSPYLTFW